MADSTANFTPAPWLVNMLNTMQADSDAHYYKSGDRANFQQAKANWISANIINRDVGLPITEFTTSVPQRVVFYATGFSSWAQKLVDDPDATKPVLPPPTPKVQGPPISTSSANAEASLNSALGQIMTMLHQIQVAMGIKG